MIRSNKASRLLRIRVQDIDDNQPVFAPNTPLSQRVYTIDENDQVGQLKAVDADCSPFNSIRYYLLESCAPDYTYAFFLNATSGELQLLDRAIEMPENLRLCALASPYSHSSDLSNLEFDRHNRSMNEFIVKRRGDRIDSRLLHFPNNTYISLDSRLQKMQIPLEMHPEQMNDRQLAFELETISFQPLKDNKQLPDSLDLFSVQLQTSEVRVDPQVVLQPEGVYTLRISAFDLVQTPKQKIGILQSQIHFVREENRLRFVFDKPIEQIGLSVQAFANQLDTILSDLEKQKVRTILSRPCAYDSIESRNRSQVCFYLVTSENQIMSPAEAINLTSTSNNPERRLFELYQQYHLISIDSCLQIHKTRSYALGGEMMSRELFVWIVLVMGAFLILLSLIGYTCFVTRYKEHLWQKTLEQTAKIPPVATYTPITATTSQAATLPTKA